MGENGKSTYQCLAKIPGVPYLYRHTVNGVYYALKKVGRKRKDHSLDTNDRELAERRLAKWVRDLERIDLLTSKTTLHGLLDKFEQVTMGRSAKTRATDASIIKRFKTTWKFGLEVPVGDVKPSELDAWMAEQEARMKKSSYNRYVGFIRQLFQIALNDRMIAESPAEHIKQKRRENPIRQTPTWEQFHKIVEEIRNKKFSAEAEHTADLVEFMGLAGVGTAECANLLGEHVDFARERITLYRQKTDTGYVIPVFPQVKALLEKLRDRGQIKNGKPVFKVRDPKKALRAACEKLNSPQFSPRSLRRSFITRAIEKGVDFKTIASWQGHRDGGVLIAKTYSHLRSEHSDAMAKKLVSA